MVMMLIESVKPNSLIEPLPFLFDGYRMGISFIPPPPFYGKNTEICSLMGKRVCCCSGSTLV